MSSNDNNKVAFSLGGNKKKKKSTAAVSAADFGATNQQQQNNNKNRNEVGEFSSSDAKDKQAPLVIPLTQQTQSLLDRIKQESQSNTTSADINIKKEEGVSNDDNNEGETAVSSANNNIKKEPKSNESNGDIAEEVPSSTVPTTAATATSRTPDLAISSGANTNLVVASASVKQEPGDNSREQLQRDLANLPDTSEDAYEQVPVSQFGAALLRGMGWVEEADATKKKASSSEGAMPRPHRLGLGAIPKAEMADDNNMPSVLSGRKNKKKKLTVAQLQQQEEYERKRELLKKQDKQRTLQVGSIVYLTGGEERGKNNSQQQEHRAKAIQLQGVPGLNMVSVQMEHAEAPCAIKRGRLGELVPRSELEKTPFVIPEPKKKPSSSNGKDRHDKDNNKDRNRWDRGEQSLNRSPSRERKKGHGRSRDRSRSPSPGGDRKKRSRDGFPTSRSRSSSRERKKDRKRSRDRDRSRSRDRDDDDRDRRRDRKDRDRDRDRKYDRKRDRDRRRRDDEDDDRRKRRRRDDDSDGSVDSRDRKKKEKRSRDSERSSSKKSRSERDNNGGKDTMWMIPNIRVRVVTEKLGKQHFRQKGVIVDVTRKHGATIRMDVSGSLLEHVPERYLETALPKPGGQAVVLTGSNKWAKGRLLERNSKISKGSIQVFEDMNIITLSLDDMAEWCGPLDDDLGE